MYIVKNSYKSIVRAKGRNLLIFILVFLIAASPLALSASGSPSALPSLRSPNTRSSVGLLLFSKPLRLAIANYVFLLYIIVCIIVYYRKKKEA